MSSQSNALEIDMVINNMANAHEILFFGEWDLKKYYVKVNKPDLT